MGSVSALITQCSALIADLVYPRRCAGCDQFGYFFCPGCRARLAPQPAHQAHQCACGRSQAGPGGCLKCQALPLGVTILSPYLYEDPLRRAIQALKYRSPY